MHNADYPLNSRIKESDLLVREAKKLGKDPVLQRDIDNLTKSLSEGNFNAGIGSRKIGQGIHEARSRNGERVYFRQLGETVEILGKSGKGNQQKVINEVLRLFGR